MDQLTIIIAIMTAIVFTWIGYFLGNYFPFLGKKQAKNWEDSTSIDKSSPGKLKQRIISYFSEREIDEARQFQGEQSVTMDFHQSEKLISPTRMKELNRVWYDKSERKLYAEYEGGVIDLDDRLTPEQHSFMSFLLLDLQEKVGISAKLRAIVAEREEEAFPKEEEEEELERPSFNPIKSFVKYVQADVPKLDDNPESITFQINEILQDKLKGSSLESLGISINEWPAKGVVFIVGVEVYDEIDQIPNSQIRHVIKESVTEWEKRENEG